MKRAGLFVLWLALCGLPGLVTSGFHLRLVTSGLVISGAGPALGADGWKTYLNGNDRAGFTTAELGPNLQLAWVYRSQAKPELAWSGPRNTPIEGHEMRHRVDFDAALQVVLTEGRAYFGSTVDNRLHCVDAKSGAPVWSFTTDGPIRLAPTLAHGNVYFGSDDGYVYCLTADEGEVVWKMRLGRSDDRLLSRGEMISRWPVRTGVLIDGELAYFGAGVFPHETIYLCAANAIDGSIVWRNDTISEQDAGRNDLSPQGYLLCNDKYLYVPSGRSLPVAISKATGEIVFQEKYSWRTDAGGVVGGTKALLGDGQVYAGGPHHFLAMNDETGDLGESWIGGRQMVLADRFAYLMDGTKIFSVDRAEHARASQEKQKWFLRARQMRGEPEKLAEANKKMEEYAGVGLLWQVPSQLDGALAATDNLVIGGGAGEVVAIDRHSGQQLWEAEVEGDVRGLAIADNMLMVSTDAGLIYAFAASDKQQLAADNGAKSGLAVKNWPEPFTEAFPQDDWTAFYADAARDILEMTGQRSGYCLVAGSEQGRLAYELARQSKLNVIAVEPDPEKAEASRLTLEKAGLHGTRITVFNQPLDQMPFANYFANLIVSETHLLTGRIPVQPDAIARHLKPCGGRIMLGKPSAAPEGLGHHDEQQIVEWLTELYHQAEGELTSNQPWYSLTRGKLPGAGDWTHQYGNIANTSYTEDQRIRDGLGVLWYGDPGPSSMINRHEAAGAPLSTNGRMFIQGTDSVMAYDAYNGNFLWEYKNPGALRTGVFNNRETHNLAASDDRLFVAVGDTCSALDAATGEVVAEYATPESSDGIDRAWAYVAYDQGQLFGTSTIRQELEQQMRRRGLTVQSQTDAVFAVDTNTGKRAWTYRGENILHTTIAIGPNNVYFIDSSISPEERQELYRRDKGELRNLTGDAAKQAEAEMKQLDLRLCVALDRRTGDKIWERPVNVTDTTEVSAGGGSLTVMYADGHLVLCGANANGHYWKQFLAGEFEKRKLLVLDAKNGAELWSKNANYMNRPAVIGQEIFAEPWAFNLHTGEEKKRPHPLTGEESQWRFSRPGHYCGVITATPNMMFFRSGFIGYYDLYHDSGTRHFAGQRMGCWINAIPGNGLVMIPEASAGCVCQFSIASTVVLEPKTENKSWGIFSAVGPSTPVNRIAINFGAPGDRKDLAGQEWFGYPRPRSVGRLEFVFDLQPQLAAGGGWYSQNVESLTSTSENGEAGNSDTDKPWVYASGARGLKRFEVPLLGPDDQPATYRVRMHFAVPPISAAPPEIELQGETRKPLILDVGSLGEYRLVTQEFQGVPVKQNLVVEMGGSSPRHMATLAAIEVEREDR